MKLNYLVFIIILIVAAVFTAGNLLNPFDKSCGKKGSGFRARAAHWRFALRLLCFPPVTYRDPNTKALSGLSVDMMEHIARDAGLKVEWTEETDFGNWIAGMTAGRFDAFCTPMWPDTAMARQVLFTRPMFYAGIFVYAQRQSSL